MSGSSDSPCSCWALNSGPCRDKPYPLQHCEAAALISCWLSNWVRAGQPGTLHLKIHDLLPNLNFSYCVLDLSKVWYGKETTICYDFLFVWKVPFSGRRSWNAETSRTFLLFQNLPNNYLFPHFVKDLCWISGENEWGEGNQQAVTWSTKSWLLRQ